MRQAPRLRATYRLQLGPDLDFAAAHALVPYLRELGVSHIYLSPVLQARAGSTHGYDVVDPTRLSEQLGGEQRFRALAQAGLGVIVDVVPNHMGIGPENRWWSDRQLRERFFDLDPAGGYRRFFDIDELAAIRQEDPEVFALSHRKVLELFDEGLIDGLRIDHPDGLADPAGYLDRLSAAGVQRIWVEKILHAAEPRETLREWPVSGTVGYEFLNDVCALFVDPTGEGPLTELLAQVTGEQRPFAAIALEAQLEQARGPFARELARLRRLGPFDAETLAQGLARLPVYRTYVEPWSGRVDESDRREVAQAGMERGLADALLLRSQPAVAAELVSRFQQTSPAVSAKGIEDTAFYRYPRLLALNEVGGDPARFGLSVAEFHRANAERARRFPEGLLATQTHDSKHSGDARARIGALSTMAAEWREQVSRWMAIGDRLRGGLRGPDRLEELALYQTLIGVWPIAGERLEGFLVKALREAKRNSSWTTPDMAWEEELVEFSRRLLTSAAFLADFEPFAARVRAAGERSALGQLLLKLSCPGVPDIYQGDELWLLSLVDPDNRRAVDWEQRRSALAALRGGEPPTHATRKLDMILKALDLRRRHPDAFAGSYAPIAAGPDVCAFERGGEVLVIVEIRTGGDWELQGAPAGRWRDVLQGRERQLERCGAGRELLDAHGLALLERP